MGVDEGGHINGKYSNGTVGSCLRRQYVKPLVALENPREHLCSTTTTALLLTSP